MAKDNEKLEINVKIDGMKESIDQLLAFCREMADRALMDKEKEEIENHKEKWEAEKEIVKKEFSRVGDMLKKAKPGTPEYLSLVEDLYKLKNIMGYWD